MKQLSVPNEEFFALACEQLQDGNNVRIRVKGCSMLPFIKGGRDEVTLRPYRKDEDLPLGACAIYKWGGNYMIHRLVRKDSDRYTFMGDGNAERLETIRRDEVQGVLTTLHHPDGTETDCTSERWYRHGMWWFKTYKMRPVLLRIWKVFDTMF